MLRFGWLLFGSFWFFLVSFGSLGKGCVTVTVTVTLSVFAFVRLPFFL